jgi:hypothetical protein
VLGLGLEQAAERADLTISATVEDKPHVLGAQIPITVTVKNLGTAKATVAKASFYTKSGSTYFSQSQDWGDLDLFGPGTTIAAGATKVVVLKGSVDRCSPRTRRARWTGPSSATATATAPPTRVRRWPVPRSGSAAAGDLIPS